MISNYFKSAFRYFLRHRFFSILNILGLAIGFSASLLLALFVWQESSYDNFHENKERIVRVIMEYKYADQQAQVATTGALVATVFSRELPEVEKAVRFAKFTVTASYDDKRYEETRFLFADSTFFDIFSFNLITGNPNEALNGPNKVVLTEEAAQRYFGDEDPVGNSLLVNNKEYEITGIIEKSPENSQIKYDLIASFASLNVYKNPVWFDANYHTYLLLQTPSSIEQLQGKIFNFMKTKEKETGLSGENYLSYHLEPLEDVHVFSAHSGLEPNIDTRYIYIFFVVSILILFIASINYMNLATARSVDRGVEVGIRKVLGAQKNQLFWQYINEAFVSVIAAAVLAWVIASLTLPLFNFMLEKSYTMDLLVNTQALLVIAGLVIIISIGAGAYPALIMSKFIPAKTLKGAFKTSFSGILLRRGLIIFQFVISATLIICSLVIYEQLSFLRNANLGYQKDHIIVQRIDHRVVEKIDAVRNSFSEHAQIEEITMAYETPTSIDWGDGISKADKTSVMTKASPVDYNYLNTLKIQLVAGKDFTLYDQEKAYSDSAHVLHLKERSVIVNETAAWALGWSPEEAIGKNVEFKGNATIVGVMKDFHFAPMHVEIGPLILFVDNIYHTMIIRIKGNDIPGTLDYMAAKWKELAPHIPFDPEFMDREYDALYSNEQQLGQLALFFTTITVILGCLGLLGLSALLISHRTQEIGIRKVMGASVPQIVTVLSRDFIKLVIIAFIIAVPLSWYAMDYWLQSFSYKIEMPYVIYFVSGIALVLLALITLSTQTIKAALRNPVEVLKSE